MSRKHYRPEDIISKLREADIHLSQAKTVAKTIRVLGIRNKVKFPFAWPPLTLPSHIVT